MTVYLPTLTHYARVSHLRTKNIDLTHRGQLLMPDSQIRTSCSITKILLNFPKKAGQEKFFEIQLPSGPVHFSFQLPPLKHYLPNRRREMFMHYQLHHLLGTVCCFAHLAVLSFLIVFDWNYH